MSDISICIPTYEFKGDGVKYLSELLDTLRTQTFKNFDVVISDHSRDDEIMNYCESVSDEFDFTYAKNPNGRGNLGPNTNCALELAEGTICKIQYQDDLFVDDEALQKIYDAYDKNDCKWTFNGFVIPQTVRNSSNIKFLYGKIVCCREEIFSVIPQECLF